MEILKKLLATADSDYVFGLAASQIDAIFRKVKAKALVHDLKFHDTRREYCSRMAQKMNVLELAQSIGHGDLNTLQVYFKTSATDIAEKLD